jgi:hypothetical protein
MSDLLTFRGETVIADGEGTFLDLTQEMIEGRSWIFRRLARGLGEIAKDSGVAGATAVFEVRFHCVGSLTPQVVRDRVATLCTPAAGTLTIKGQPTLNNCVLLPPVRQETRKIKGGYRIVYSLAFRQLRP